PRRGGLWPAGSRHFLVGCARAPVLSSSRNPGEPLLRPVDRAPVMNEALTPNELLEQALQGDREALGRLLETQRAVLHRLAQRQLQGRIAVRVDASDVIQQTFLEAHRTFPQFAGEDARELIAWLECILDHKIAGAIRDHTLLQKRAVGRERSLDDSQG